MRPDDEGLGVPGASVDDAAEPAFTADGHLTEGTAHAFVDGALDDADAARVIGHVAECARCAGAVAEARGLAAAATRILGALDDVPAEVVPSEETARVVPPSAPGRVVSGRVVLKPGAPAGGSRWTAWPVRAAAGLLLAAGVGSAAWRASSARRSDAGESAAHATSGAAAVADTAAPASTLEAPAATAASAPAPSVVATVPMQPPVAPPGAPPVAPSGALRESVGRELSASMPAPRVAGPRAARAPELGAGVAGLEVATVDTAIALAEPSPSAPLPPPPAPAAAPPEPDAAKLRTEAQDAARGVAPARRAAAPPDTTASARAYGMRARVPADGGGCFVLAGVPALAGATLPVRVTLDPAGRIRPEVAGVTGRWRAVGDSLRLGWTSGAGSDAARREVRLGPPDRDGVRRGAASGEGAVAGSASARPVRCDGGLR